MKTCGLPLKLGILTLALVAFGAVQSSAGQSAPAAERASASQPGNNDRTEQSATGDAGTALHKRNWRYRINPSDTLELTFAQAPEFNQTVTVQPDGYITLRVVGDLPAGGQTLPELTASIKTAYSKIMQDPEVTVDPKEFEKPFFTVGGQVGKPGSLIGTPTLPSHKPSPLPGGSQTLPSTPRCCCSGAFRMNGARPRSST